VPGSYDNKRLFFKCHRLRYHSEDIVCHVADSQRFMIASFRAITGVTLSPLCGFLLQKYGRNRCAMSTISLLYFCNDLQINFKLTLKKIRISTVHFSGTKHLRSIVLSGYKSLVYFCVRNFSSFGVCGM